MLVLQPQENPLTILYVRQRRGQKRDQKCDAEPRSNEGILFNVQEECIEKHG